MIQRIRRFPQIIPAEFEMKLTVLVATVFLHLPGIVPLARKYLNPITLQTKCRLQLGNLESCK